MNFNPNDPYGQQQQQVALKKFTSASFLSWR